MSSGRLAGGPAEGAGLVDEAGKALCFGAGDLDSEGCDAVVAAAFVVKFRGRALRGFHNQAGFTMRWMER